MSVSTFLMTKSLNELKAIFQECEKRIQSTENPRRIDRLTRIKRVTAWEILIEIG